MKMNKLILFFLIFISTSVAFAQNAADSARSAVPDVIIKTNGDLFQCRITEVTGEMVNYRLPDQDDTSPAGSLPRSEVYAVAYANGVAMVITPRLLDKDLYKTEIEALAKKKADSILRSAEDFIIKTNGNLFHCRIVEINDSLVVYSFPETDTAGQVRNIPRGEVYTIVYGNKMTQVITPELMGQEAFINPYKGTCEGWDNFKKNLGSGSINIGVGFMDVYSPIKDADSFEDNKTMPSVFAGYTFRIKGHLKGGVHIGIGGNELTYTGVSEYDQLKISTTIKESFFVLGLYARYDVLDGMFKPYVKGGLDFIGVFMTTTSESQSLDGSSASLKTIVDQNGIKPGLILRGGMELIFGDAFGIYGDVGTGLSLVQVGVLFNF